MAGRQRIRALQPHALARAAEQVSGRLRPGADRARSAGNRQRGAGISRADVRAAAGTVAEKPGPGVEGIVDRSEDEEDDDVQLRHGARGIWWPQPQPVRSGVRSDEAQARDRVREGAGEDIGPARPDQISLRLGWWRRGVEEVERSRVRLLGPVVAPRLALLRDHDHAPVWKMSQIAVANVIKRHLSRGFLPRSLCRRTTGMKLVRSEDECPIRRTS